MWRKRSMKTSQGKKLVNIQNVLTSIVSKCQMLCDDIQIRYEEMKNEIDKHIAQDKKNKHTIDQNSAIIAQLYQDVEEKDMRISDMITQMQKPDKVDEVTCECCCIPTLKDNCLICSSNHMICKTCVDQSCKEYYGNVQHSSRKISCCSMHNCSGYIPEHQFSQTFYGKSLLQDFFLRDITPMLLEYIKIFSNEEIQKNLAFLRSDGTFRAFQCPECGFGPIIHAHCSDLLSHHGQHTEGNVMVNNSCPNCKFLAKDVHDLHDWDGR